MVQVRKNTTTYREEVNPYAACGWFGQNKMIWKKLKMSKTLAYWYSSDSIYQKLSNEFQHYRV